MTTPPENFDYYFSNGISDSIWNRCLLGNDFIYKFGFFFTPIFGWSEPYPMAILSLVLLIILPTIFRIGQFQKASRLYSISRLSILSIFHQISYAYTLIKPMATVIGCNSPCYLYSTQFKLEYSLPSMLVSSAAFFLYTVTKLSGLSMKFLIPVWFISLSVLGLFAIAAGFTSVFQFIFTVCFTYIVHMWHQYLPFRYIHYENLVLFIFCLVVFIYYGIKYGLRLVIFQLMFSIFLPIIDEVILIRHHLTRGDFSMIERPLDINFKNDSLNVETIRLLNSEEEEVFYRNIREDMLTSVFCFFIFLIPMFIRSSYMPDNFFGG
ncbi:hypothetical protein TVAG_222010 [Trichomonas vaginalis G3]|uniref:Uncharacterized protein n=1 Tax=Trichomonas vaginalis (strain ATCC PRA-98 / G3) TaxID=412133 RepID=A2E3F6_TRIV3|nr:hypothetical protein TVAGG3_0969620 [Trichomonas vaginalis G3]EAY12847.1 hypothetical protein TVAG_222010 [Trichomonas vaginalis G3]KAI5488496.1 hypothetical protein TVAGG3_0969620 [Trichomonas vaginalis G3]|eukprot:XP_001325070.1 hypothetical protein [Trichomonas vaginalis G3]